MKTKRIKITAALIFAVLICALALVYFHRRYGSGSVKIEYFNTYDCENGTDRLWWDKASSPDFKPLLNEPPFESDYAFLNEVDFENYNALITYGHKAAEVKRLILKYGAVKVYMEPEYCENKLFVYLVKKNTDFYFDTEGYAGPDYENPFAEIREQREA